MHCALAMASLRRNQVDNQACCMVEELDASSIGDLAKAVQQIFGDTWTNIIGTRYGEKLFETLMNVMGSDPTVVNLAST